MVYLLTVTHFQLDLGQTLLAYIASLDTSELAPWTFTLPLAFYAMVSLGLRHYLWRRPPLISGR